MRIGSFQCLSDDILRSARRDDGPIRARDLKSEIGSDGLAILTGGVRLGSGRARQRLEPAARVDRPLQVEPRSHGIRYVWVNDSHAAGASRNAELFDVIGARVARHQRKLRTCGRFPLVLNGSRGVFASHQLGKPMACLEPAGNRFRQSQSNWCGLGTCQTSAGQAADDRQQ